MNRNSVIPFALLAFCALTACSKNEIQYYEIPKETRNVPTRADGLPPGHPPTTGLSPGITWKTPEGWEEGEPQGAVKGSFHIHRKDRPHAEMVVLDFPPHAVQIEDFANLLSDELKIASDHRPTGTEAFEKFTAGEKEFTLIRLTSETPLNGEDYKTSVLAAILKEPSRIWFFNLKGAEPTVLAESDNFFEFLKSIEIDQDPHAGLGDGMAMAMQSLPEEAVSQEGNPQWTVPEEWEPGRPSQMRRGSFQVMGENNQMADIAVTTFPGDVGGMLANINRWRGQVGLGPITAGMTGGVIKDMEINGKQCQYVDLVGMDPPTGKIFPQRSLVGTFLHEGNSWFFKMSGDSDLVETQKQNFMDFLNSVRF